MPKNIKELFTRIITKHDLEVNWLRNSSFVPMQGELIIYDCEVDANGNTLELPSDRSVPYDYERLKLGDGFTLVNDLQFINEDILAELTDINTRIGSTSVADQISEALAKQTYFSGDYNDLTNTPVLPKYVSDLEDDLGIATTEYIELVKKQIPTLISQLENDANYVNDTELQAVRESIPDVSNLVDKEYVEGMLSTIPKFEIKVVGALPTENISSTTVYLVTSGEATDSLYDEYIYVNGAWELLGSAKINLDGYAKLEDLPTKVSQLENDANYTSKEEVEALFNRLSSDTVLRFYCIEDVTIVLNGVSTTYPANSNVEVKFVKDDEFEIIPTSDNSILALNAYPGALGTYYSWLEGVKQFSNILFDMNAEDMYTKWNQGNQGAYQVQYAQYLNCIFWSDNPYIADLAKRTNYTLYYSSQLPLCYSSIPENTFKAFYLAFNVNSDPNWGNKAYRDSFAQANWATQVFSYYGARTIGIFGHDDPDFNIILPPDCRGLMSAATAIENAGTFDAINVTNFGAKSGSWRDAFGWCNSLRQLYIKNLKVNLNVSWSPLDYDSIYFIISTAANTSAITISVSPYTYNLLGPSDFELAASKNITIALLTTNYVEDRRLSAITIKGDGSTVLSNDGTYKTLPTKTSQLENDSNFITEHQSLENYITKDEAFSGDYNDLTNAPDVSTFVTQDALDTKADKSEIPDITGLATETWVADYVTEALNNQPDVPEGPVTTEYEYSYDGDTSDTNTNTWVYNYGGTKVFAKMGDIPEGELNLVGSTLFRTNPSNEWLNRTFTITEEHLTKVLNKAETDIPATQDGLIQIYDTMASDFSEFTVLCICTKPGWYNVCFDDWYEIIEFTETGIFAYDKRPYGGNDYLQSFTFSATVYPDQPESGGGTTPTTPTSPVNYTGSEIQMFHRGICIGDSVTEGSFDNDENGFIVKEYSYPSNLARLTGIDIVNAGIAGATSQTWYEASLNSDSLWGKWVNQGWVWNTDPAVTLSDTVSSTLSYSGFDFAIIHLGINDLGLTYGETPLDEVLTNFELYIGNIITKLKEANSGIKIFLATIIPSYATPGNQSYVSLNNKIKAIVEVTADTYLLDLNQYSEIASDPAYNRIHPTALGYQKLAAEIKALVSYVIKNNLDEFKNVQFTTAEVVSGFKIQKITQESYDALNTKDPNTLYIIV